MPLSLARLVTRIPSPSPRGFVLAGAPLSACLSSQLLTFHLQTIGGKNMNDTLERARFPKLPYILVPLENQGVNLWISETCHFGPQMVAVSGTASWHCGGVGPDRVTAASWCISRQLKIKNATIVSNYCETCRNTHLPGFF